MKTFDVELVYTRYDTVKVRAETFAEAEKIAHKRLDDGPGMTDTYCEEWRVGHIEELQSQGEVQ